MTKDIDLFGFHWFLSKNKIILSFEGVLSQEILINLAEMIKKKINTEDKMEMFAKKVFGIFIELAQNIQRYSIEKEIYADKELGNGSIVALDMDDYYAITSCNKIYEKDVARIASYCDMINSLDKEGLKSLYKSTLKVSEAEHRKTGGVGLIDIIRKSGNPIHYKIVAINSEEAYLVLSTKIDKSAGGLNE